MRTRLTHTAVLSAILALGALVGLSATTAAGSVGSAPQAVPPPLQPAGPGCAAIPADGAGSLAVMSVLPAGNAVAAAADLSTLAGAVAAAGLTDALNGAGPMTVLAPANAAFEKIPANVLDSILADNELLTTILGFHVIDGQALSVADLLAAGTVASSQGSDLTFADDGGTVMVNGSAAVVCADIQVGNGVVHILDSVLQPPSSELGGDGSTSVPSSAPNITAVATPGDGPQGPACANLPAEGEGSLADMAGKTAAEAIATNPLLTQLAAAIEAADLTEALSGPGPFTIFAPSDEAFAAVPAADLEAVMNDPATLTSVLTYHAVEGEALTAADLATLGTSVTVQGGELAFTAQPDGSLSINNGQSVVTCSNIPVANGIIHIVGSILVPPAG